MRLTALALEWHMPDVNPAMIVLAREAQGLTQKDLAEQVLVQQATISKIEAGAMTASPSLVCKFAETLHVPEILLLQHDPIYPFGSTVFFHRKRHSLPQKPLRQIHALCNLMRMRVSRLIAVCDSDHQGRVRLDRVLPPDKVSAAEDRAADVRRRLGLPSGPIDNLTSVIEAAGGVVVRMDMGTTKIDAISEWVDGYPPMFFVNSHPEITADRLRLTIAHELGHLVMHSMPSSDAEPEANRFAAAFLMPRREIEGSLHGLSLNRFDHLARLKVRWRVSMQALVQRAYDLGLMSDSRRRAWFIAFSQYGMRRREPIEIEGEEPQLIGRWLSKALKRTPRRELARKLLLLPEDFDTWIRQEVTNRA